MLSSLLLRKLLDLVQMFASCDTMLELNVHSPQVLQRSDAVRCPTDMPLHSHLHACI